MNAPKFSPADSSDPARIPYRHPQPRESPPELVVPHAIPKDEREWVDGYHARVREAIGPQLDGDAKTWLDAATAPL